MREAKREHGVPPERLLHDGVHIHERVLVAETRQAVGADYSVEFRLRFLEDIRDKICFVGMMESCNREFKLLCELIVNVSTYTTIKECLTYPHEIV